jgi:hypothetical protein
LRQWRSGHWLTSTECQLSANSGHRALHSIEQRGRHGKTEGFRSFEIDDEFELGRRLNRQVTGLLALEDAVDVAGGTPVGVSSSLPISANIPRKYSVSIIFRPITIRALKRAPAHVRANRLTDKRHATTAVKAGRRFVSQQHGC